ncbi:MULTISPECIES: carboxy terminal-processing peptidase [unclassified Kaistella]|uniref:carboxy terminal-processing peptidase n=1 Tax=unclassified Kaistella TaxID=2762626 RepID=UPI002732896E|nr:MULTISPECIES: carboxy terminal-processing peptidase [unclassified Kaistella]MCZ2085394.1 carboxy terminal-processing peptidase [Flavobacteriales bacterium]MDP2452984.1 carboxy terminal-processing peptidase [Kaistella sp. SH11-4b]MDP2455893.1 carboxy terminal-processing peptidase [Kaistella sp. SH40-3]MDP2458797.1 carboxy terminal-processing peptidase [Kaistella sp. SH19-2b]
MFKKFKLNKLLLFIPLTSLVFCFNTPKNDDEKMSTIMISVKNAISYLHYSPKPINDAYSQDVYKHYFEMVDNSKRYFLQSDMAEFAQHKTKLDDYLNQGDLRFYKLTIDRLYQRVDEIDKITQDILSKPINLDEDETLVLEPKIKNNPANQSELAAEWKKYIKYNILQEMESLTAKEEMQKEKKDSVQKFNLKDTIKLEILTPEAKRIKATEEVKDLVTDTFRRFKKRNKMDWFTVYMNAYTEVFDPHTNYYSPKNKEDFDTQFKGKIIGIGAVIQEKKGNLYLGELTIGAPAWKSKQLTSGDKILKVRSSPDQDAVSVVGMLVDEAVRLIRGKEGTKVVLTVEKKDKSIQEVTMTREEVAIEDTFARSIVVNSSDGKKYGFINLPSFNADFEDPKGRNASDDIKNELIKLKAQNVEGIVLDLRNNGGGSLTEVGDIMGLFMNAGAYVQVKDGDGKIQTLKNKSNTPLWTGPLVIMQNELSASASEILAGAIQDYGRGVVIGSPQSFGKGTVQTFVDLNRYLNTSDDFGSIKLTIQKFYRISGESTQRKGIQSDIQMKDFFTYAEIGERFDEYALAWDKIPAVQYQPLNYFSVTALQKGIEARLKENKTYQLIQQSAQWKENLDKEETISLNQTKFNEVMQMRKSQIKKFKSLTKFNNGLKFTVNPDEAVREKTDEAFAKKTENWTKNLQRDLYLQEAINVISEMK